MTREKRDSERRIESYEHRDKQRVNNPPVGLVTPETDPDAGQQKKRYAYDPHLDPQLVWAGKAEHTSFEVPTVSLHVHERIDPKSIIEAVRKRNGQPVQLGLFEEEREEPLREAIEFYRHKHDWSNRLIAGDSLLVMNSLLEKEGMAGKVQMIYIDPPYGIKYGSNFQPFVNKRDVKDGRDEDLTAEPEQIKAFRDTWELGIHSYLSYLRDRLVVARDLLTESGSIFVQIGDENLHLVRSLLDEVFGRQNFCAQISFRTTTGATGILLPGTVDYILWYAKSRDGVRYNQLFRPKGPGGQAGGAYSYVELPDGRRRRLFSEERADPQKLPPGSQIYRLDNLTSQSAGRQKGEGAASWFEVELDGRKFTPTLQSRWKTNKDGMMRLKAADRLGVAGNTLSYVRFIDDFPAFPLNNFWDDTSIAGFGDPKMYVVQTNTKVIERCMLMTTEPGDLVLDPTCGSATTAFVAEQRGRRWITIDTSRVALALARQRIVGAKFPFYLLADSPEGRAKEAELSGQANSNGATSGDIHKGFVYERVPHIKLETIARNPEIKPGMTPAEIGAAIRRHAEVELLYDRPYEDKKKVRVSGPFTVESLSPHKTLAPTQPESEQAASQEDSPG